MKSSPAPTVRSLARALGLSHTTVSDALRGKGRVDPETAERVRQAADEAGYRRNPLAAAVMSELRRSRGGTFRGVLAALDLYEPGRAPHGPFHRELLQGGRNRALELGFKLEEFIVGVDGMTVQRLDGILQSRGINGVLLLPSWYPPDWTQLDWSRYAAIYTDYVIDRPPVHCVCCNHYRSVLALLAILVKRGYRRPGLYVERDRDDRMQRRFSAAFRSYQEAPGTPIEFVPPLITDQRRQDEFTAWFKRYKPDVVLGHFTDAIDWMEAAGARLPETHGFAALNVLYRTRPTAGLDQQAQELGARAVELLIAQLQRNETGIPQWPTTTTIPARWVEGPTIRLAAPAPEAAPAPAPRRRRGRKAEGCKAES
ncbi:LacI family DNA-binding transcriptional regulator [Opitutus sp. ER46]|uniref:LacI family DNA-binding transcriptional regulator n=1 Tax=Opitutus sp. ER46 TaxID=2161864 RepID=UPI000D31073C|nr:LacI family DNA-binding transcriptional regulator [Opitutus sp. ER46]PTX95677.1 LacI family transcriptional regulator [Opitutus sp. ER46]